MLRRLLDYLPILRALLQRPKQRCDLYFRIEMWASPTMADVSESAESTMFNASYFEPAPAHRVDFVACGAEMG